MSCEREGHRGAEDHHIQPKYRCFYCGEWGYAPFWWTEDKVDYEYCDCDLPYEEHMKVCDDQT